MHTLYVFLSQIRNSYPPVTELFPDSTESPGMEEI